MHTIVKETDSALRPGMELVVVGWIAMEGTVILADRKQELLREKFPEALLREARGLKDFDFPGRTEPLLAAFGEHESFALGEGGILAALWEIADRAGLGLEADLRKIPIRQETVEITELFDVNPYCLLSGGALLVGTFRGHALADALKREGIPAAVIGNVTKDTKRILYNQEIVRYVDKPARDEIFKIK